MLGWISLAGAQEVLDDASCEVLRNEQLSRPSLERLASEIDLHLRCGKRCALNDKVSRGFDILEAVNDETAVGLPRQVEARILRISSENRNLIPRRARLHSCQELRSRRYRLRIRTRHA